MVEACNNEHIDNKSKLKGIQWWFYWS